MLSHALATVALAEAFGLSGDKDMGKAAQVAVDFIVAAQDQRTGGWAADAGQMPRTAISVQHILALTAPRWPV